MIDCTQVHPGSLRSTQVHSGPTSSNHVHSSPIWFTQVYSGQPRSTQVNPGPTSPPRTTQVHPGPPKDFQVHPRSPRSIQFNPGPPSSHEGEGDVLVMLQWFTYLKECIGRATAICTIFDLGLFGQILSWVDRRIHLGCSQESSQVGSVRWDHNKCKEPPHSSNHSCWYSPKNGDMILETCRECYVQFRF